MKTKRITQVIILTLLVEFVSIAYAFPRQENHDNDLREHLFGQDRTLMGEKLEKFQAIADAASLCIDQFSTNGTERRKEGVFNQLDEHIGFSFSFDEVELKPTGKYVVNANTHRSYTHRGWNFTEYPLKELWTMRKKILTATVNTELFGQSPGVLKYVPWVEKLVYSEEACNDQCEAFCELVYYIHILGDYKEATSYSEAFQQLIPLVRHEDSGSPAIIDELIDLVPLLFEKSSNTSPSFILKLEKIKERAKKVLFATGGIRTQEQFDEYYQCAMDLRKVIKNDVPGMLMQNEFFWNAFYK